MTIPHTTLSLIALTLLPVLGQTINTRHGTGGLSGDVIHDGAFGYGGTQFQVNNSGDNGSTTRKSYVRLDTSGLAGTVTVASLELVVSLIDEGNIGGNDQTIHVFGLTDEGQDGWDPSTMDWGNAPANDTESAYLAEASGATLLGTILLDATGDKAAPVGTVVRLSNQAVIDFLNADTNGRITLILGRTGTESGRDLLFAGDNHPALAAPTLLVTTQNAEIFGTGDHGFTMDFVSITAGATADVTGYGAVGHDYRIAKYEVSERMIDAYNALSRGPVIDARSRGRGTPAGFIKWNEAARFVNWLNVSSGYCPAYKFTAADPASNISLWTTEDEGFDATNPYRNSNAYYFLPSENEWYRAAFYDPGAKRYWIYATGSNSLPTKVAGGTTPGTVVWDQSGPALVTNAGGLSPFGTMAQTGNAFELTESETQQPNDNPSSFRVARGGSWGYGQNSVVASSNRVGISPNNFNFAGGFRMASAIQKPAPMIMKQANLRKNGSTVTADIVSTCGKVAVYRSIDLQNWIRAIPADLTSGAGVIIDEEAPADRAFYILLPDYAPAP